MRRGLAVGLFLAIVGVGAAWADDLPELSVGVAPFEAAAAQAGSVPDLATLLADRLSTAGVERVVGPAQLGAPALARPHEESVRSWAERSSVGSIVVGRTTRIGRRLSVDVQLRSGESGQVIDTYVAEIQRPEDTGAAIDSLAQQVRAGLDGGAPAGSSTRPVAAAPAADESTQEGSLFTSRRGPISIKADQLEARQNEGARHLIFTENVRVKQDDVNLTSDRLDAYYPAGSSQPDKLVATGRVVVVRDEGTARCRTMTYLRADEMIHCEGDAEIVQNGDRARGDRIDWDLTTDTIFIRGNADILLEDEEDDDASDGTPVAP